MCLIVGVGGSCLPTDPPTELRTFVLELSMANATTSFARNMFPIRSSFKTIETDGCKMFYREAGPAEAPAVLLLHGFPTSSHQYRELIPRLATRYRVIAPDLPGFGFTVVPEERKYKYSFDALAHTV